VIAFVGRCQAGEFSRSFVVEIALVYDDSAERRGVAVGEFRRAVRDDVCAEIKRAAERGGREGVVDHKRYLCGFGDFREFVEVEDFYAGVRERFSEDEFCIRAYCRRYFVFVRVLVYERGFDSQLAEGVSEKVCASAVYRACADDMVARGAKVERHKRRRTLPARRGNRADASAKCRHFLFKAFHRGIA